MKQTKYQQLVDRWILFYDAKFTENRSEQIRATLESAEASAKRFGVWTDAKTAEIRALKNLEGWL